VAQRVLDYARTAPLAPRVTATYLGGEAGRKLLDAAGAEYSAATTIPNGAKLMVVGADANVDAAQLETFARNGGKVLFLARGAAQGALGTQLKQEAKFTGSLNVPNWPEARGLSASDLRFRNEAPAWLLTNVAQGEIGADGLLARRVVGNGVLLWAQFNPELLDADKNTYLRLTRWRQTRALSQVLANLGASFTLDNRIFRPEAPQAEVVVPLTGEWQARLVKKLGAAPSPDKGHNDPGISAEAKALVADNATNDGWQTAKMPNGLESLGGQWTDADGEAVFKRSVEIPAALQGQDLVASFGSLDDFDEVFWNGQSIGKTGAGTEFWWAVKRNYTVPKNLVRPGKNTLSVRIWDRFGGGGFTGRPDELVLRSAVVKEAPQGFYHPDYRADFEMGDDPHRYYNW
jgi:hypothetical protein